MLQVDQDDVEYWLGFIAENYKKTNSLIILDDCASCQSVKNRTSNLVSFEMHGRHTGFSTVVMAQQFTAVTPAFRLNAHHILVFYTLYESDWEALRKKFLTRLTKEQYDEISWTLEDRKELLRTQITHTLHIGKGNRDLVLPNKNVIHYVRHDKVTNNRGYDHGTNN